MIDMRKAAIWIKCDGAPDLRIPGTWPVKYAREVEERSKRVGVTVRVRVLSPSVQGGTRPAAFASAR